MDIARAVSKVERISRHLVWNTPLEQIGTFAGALEDTSPGMIPQVTFHGFGVSRDHERSPIIYEAYCGQSIVDSSAAVKRTLAISLNVPANTIRIIPCGGFIPQLAGGDRGAHERLALSGGYGTIGGFARDLTGGHLLMVSNNHVFADCNAGKSGDRLISNGHEVGKLARFQPLAPQPGVNVLDGAVGLILATETTQGSVPPGSVLATPGMKVHKHGARTGLTHGTIQGVAATAVLPYQGIGTVNFRRCLRIVGDQGAFSLPGDSGSLVLNHEDLVVGIIFAGELNGLFSLANPVDALTGRLGIAFY